MREASGGREAAGDEARIAERTQRALARLAGIEEEVSERLSEAERLQDDFLATVSHELRTPLTSIKGYARTLMSRERELTPEERHSFLEVMVKQCDRLAQIIDTMLLVSRLEADEIEGRRTYIGLSDLLNEAAEASTEDDRIEIRSDKGVGLTSDHFRIFHIMRNLMENACKYSPPGSPVLVTTESRGDRYEITVHDQGAGVADDDRERIFTRFGRLEEPHAQVISGSGLGLYIARRFARDLGAEVMVENGTEPPWTGARFTLTLPIEVLEGAGPDPTP
jgi:signal transduction histidine kinase